jgi:hypothetical protein
MIKLINNILFFDFLQGQYVFQDLRERKEGGTLLELHTWEATCTLLL